MSVGGLMIAKSTVRRATVEAVIIRADGRVENLGVIAAYHRNPIKRVAHNFWYWLKGKLR